MNHHHLIMMITGDELSVSGYALAPMNYGTWRPRSKWPTSRRFALRPRTFARIREVHKPAVSDLATTFGMSASVSCLAQW